MQVIQDGLLALFREKKPNIYREVFLIIEHTGDELMQQITEDIGSTNGWSG
jgi:hypothetical protein